MEFLKRKEAQCDALKGANVITVTVEHYENHLASIFIYEISCSPRPPELPFGEVGVRLDCKVLHLLTLITFAQGDCKTEAGKQQNKGKKDAHLPPLMKAKNVLGDRLTKIFLCCGDKGEKLKHMVEIYFGGNEVYSLGAYWF